jgi:putative Holliday junction resolvase
MKKLLGLDIGERNIGIAISDGLGITAQPLTTIRRKNANSDIEAIKKIIEEHQAKEIVVGLPKNMDGSIGTQAQKAILFADKLRQCLDIRIILRDERLTTVIAEKTMLEGDLSRRKRKKRIDKIAAQLILQNYLDSKKFSSQPENNETE